MGFRAILVITLVVSAFMQVTNGQSAQVISQATSLIKNMTKMTTSLTTGISTLTKLTKNIKSIEASFMNKAAKMIRQPFAQMSNLTTSLASIFMGTKFSSQLSRCMDMTECFKVRAALCSQAHNCIKKEANITMKLMNAHINALKQLSAQTAKLTANITKCTTSASMSCFNYLRSNMTVMAMRIPAQVYSCTSQSMQAVTTLPIQMSVCSTKLALQAQKGAASAGMRHVSCFMKLLSGSYNSSTASTTSKPTTTTSRAVLMTIPIVLPTVSSNTGPSSTISSQSTTVSSSSSTPLKAIAILPNYMTTNSPSALNFSSNLTISFGNTNLSINNTSTNATTSNAINSSTTTTTIPTTTSTTPTSTASITTSTTTIP